MKSLSVTIQMKATEQYFPVVLIIMLYKVVLTFESVDEIQAIVEAIECLFLVVLFLYCLKQLDPFSVGVTKQCTYLTGGRLAQGCNTLPDTRHEGQGIET